MTGVLLALLAMVAPLACTRTANQGGSGALAPPPGDDRGLYRIVGRRQHPRWSRFILIDYPNLSDRDDHRKALDEGIAERGPGGEIGIHGTDKANFNELGIDWTFGCVALMNDDVDELYETVPNGTLVLIEE